MIHLIDRRPSQLNFCDAPSLFNAVRSHYWSHSRLMSITDLRLTSKPSRVLLLLRGQRARDICEDMTGI